MSCTQNCNQGRCCTCRPTGDAYEWIDELRDYLVSGARLAALVAVVAFLVGVAVGVNT